MKDTTTMAHRIAKLSVPVTGAALPTEFRLFKAGPNPTAKGTFLFDEEAAAAVMAEYEAHGVDLAIDLEHQMLDGEGSPDPTARDARGWCRLALRNGELWAVAVKWTPDGALRLAERRQRYVSPAFEIDPGTQRIIKVVNVAITSTPATFQTPALVAASRSNRMNPDQVKQALDALINGDADACAEILKDILAAAAAGGAEAPADAAPGAPAPGKNPKTPPAGAAEPSDVTASLLRLSGVQSLAGVLGHLQSLTKENQTLSSQVVEFEAAERRRLCAKLVVDAGHTPSQAWEQFDSQGNLQNGVPKRHLAAMSLSELRQHVEDETRIAISTGRAPKRVTRTNEIKPPAGNDGGRHVVATSIGPVDVSAREVRMCTEMKIDLVVYATRKAQQAQSRGEAGAR